MSVDLSEINGVKPKIFLRDGVFHEVKSLTSDTVYKVKRVYDHYYCTCPAWTMQGRVSVDCRSCKHLRQVLGDDYEDARMKWKDPDWKPATGKKSRAPAKGKGKAKPDKSSATANGKRKRDDGDAGPSKKVKGDKGDDDDEEDDEDDDDSAPTSSAKIKVDVLLANKWEFGKGPDPTGWWCSEKLDGVRAYYNGAGFYSRLGNSFSAPQWFLDKLPKDIILDGELFCGRGKFAETVSIVKTRNSTRWKEITFQIFDIPSRGSEPFEARVKWLDEKFSGKNAIDQIHVVSQTYVKDQDHIVEMLKDVETKGGEGLMLRKPKSQYEPRRSSTLLKIKTFYDAEAKVIGHEKGKGRNQGVTGALKCVMASGKEFNVGTGLNDKQRRNPPKVGTIVVYRFQELTRDGVPRFPSYVGEAIDKTEAKDADVPDHRKPGAASD